MKYDLSEYENLGEDFGFTTTDKIVETLEVEKLVVDTTAEQEVLDLRKRITALEKMIMPLLLNLKKNPENAYIHWPNRAPLIDEQIKKILDITRTF